MKRHEQEWVSEGPGWDAFVAGCEERDVRHRIQAPLRENDDKQLDYYDSWDRRED
jgi:hypothetical protein